MAESSWVSVAKKPHLDLRMESHQTGDASTSFTDSMKKRSHGGQCSCHILNLY